LLHPRRGVNPEAPAIAETRILAGSKTAQEMPLLPHLVGVMSPSFKV
jgi:hypothetical protein